MRIFKRSLCAMAVAGCALACQPVKPYQRAYLNDHEMRPGLQGAQLFEENVHTYREGAAGGGSGRSSGGCGCN